jgi:hypothetical protein
MHPQYFLHVNPDGREWHFPVAPDGIPALRVIVEPGGVELTATYNAPDPLTRLPMPVRPRGLGWRYGSKAGGSTIWVRDSYSIGQLAQAAGTEACLHE